MCFLTMIYAYLKNTLMRASPGRSHATKLTGILSLVTHGIIPQIKGGDLMKWLIEQLKYTVIVLAAIAPLGIFNTIFEIYLYEH